jgi:hypothetical protein
MQRKKDAVPSLYLLLALFVSRPSIDGLDTNKSRTRDKEGSKKWLVSCTEKTLLRRVERSNKRTEKNDGANHQSK